MSGTIWPVCRFLPAAALLAAAIGGPLAGCGSGGPYTWARDLPPPAGAATLAAGPAGPAQPVIQPRDTLLVIVANQKEMSGEFPVRDDGSYLQPQVGVLPVAGRTAAQVVRDLSARLDGVISNPHITVSIPKRAPIKVHVIGEVRAPATYELERDRSVTAGLAAAGWLNDFASRDGIYVVRPRESPARIRFRLADLKAAEAHSALFELRDGDVVVVE